MNYKELLCQGEEVLKQNHIEDASLDAWYLMEAVSSFSRAEFFLYNLTTVSQEVIDQYLTFVMMRGNHIPLQYILGYTEFMGLKFFVNDQVLIPRQETEILVELCGNFVKDKKVLDMCTGSGCIIISLEKLYDVKEAYGVDLSLEALKVAEKNVQHHKSKARLIHSNLFDCVHGRYDVIVSNPPYIKSSEIDSLMPEVGLHEPRMALDGREDGLWFYREIVNKAPKHLERGGRVLFEIGQSQSEDLVTLFMRNNFTDIEVYQDYAGYNRIVSAVYRGNER